MAKAVECLRTASRVWRFAAFSTRFGYGCQVEPHHNPELMESNIPYVGTDTLSSGQLIGVAAMSSSGEVFPHSSSSPPTPTSTGAERVTEGTRYRMSEYMTGVSVSASASAFAFASAAGGVATRRSRTSPSAFLYFPGMGSGSGSGSGLGVSSPSLGGCSITDPIFTAAAADCSPADASAIATTSRHHTCPSSSFPLLLQFPLESAIANSCADNATTSSSYRRAEEAGERLTPSSGSAAISSARGQAQYDVHFWEAPRMYPWAPPTPCRGKYVEDVGHDPLTGAYLTVFTLVVGGGVLSSFEEQPERAEGVEQGSEFCMPSNFVYWKASSSKVEDLYDRAQNAPPSSGSGAQP